MWTIVVNNFRLSTKIILMVTTLLIIVEYLELKFKDKIREKITGRPMNQYIIASLLGAVPGCLDAFLIVSLYIHGLVGFGALTAVMLSTAGDEAFIMLAMAPDAAWKIFIILIGLGMIGGFLADKVIQFFNIETCEHCIIEIHEEQSSSHFLIEHVYGHILKEHIPKLFIWIFIPLTLVEFLIQRFDFASMVSTLPLYTLIIFAALIGIIPESGPHMIFLREFLFTCVFCLFSSPLG